MLDNAFGEHIGSLQELISQIEAPGKRPVSPLCFFHSACGLQATHRDAKVTTNIWLVLAGVFLSGVIDSLAASPALVVHGLGHLPTPITPEQSIQLKALCSPDPDQLDGATSDPARGLHGS